MSAQIKVYTVKPLWYAALLLTHNSPSLVPRPSPAPVFDHLPRLQFLIACSTASDQKLEPGKAWERSYNSAIADCVMGSHTIKGTDNGLYGEDPAQNLYFTGFPVEYTYISQTIRGNIVIKNLAWSSWTVTREQVQWLDIPLKTKQPEAMHYCETTTNNGIK